MIDGVNIEQVPLSRLRHSVHVLPQEPLLFEGTLRENLDFRGQLSDRALWDALELCGLKEYFRFGLDSPIELKGANLSAGQTQLLCMARAILQKPKVFIIDEGGSTTPILEFF
jgi:ABC-type multidrug transport system fused ATPase/permease subunit